MYYSSQAYTTEVSLLPNVLFPKMELQYVDLDAVLSEFLFWRGSDLSGNS